MDNWVKKMLISLGLLIFGAFALKYVFIYFSPFIIAAVFASLINPIVDELEKRLPIKRGLTVIVVLGLLITIMVILLIIGVSQIYLELNKLLRNLPDYNTIGSQFQWVVNRNNQLQEFINNLDLSPAVRDTLNNNLQMLYDAVKNGLIRLINNVLALLSKLPLIFTILFLSFIATFFITRDKDIINEFIMKLFPTAWKAKVFKIQKDIMNSAVGFIRAELILISITGIIAGVGLAILGNEYALIIGISAALLDFIPIIGPALIFYPWIAYTLLLGNLSFAFALLVLHTLLAAVRSGAEGKIMGSNLGMHPLSTMIALYVGYRMMGALGFLIGPSLLIIIKAVMKAELFTIKE